MGNLAFREKLDHGRIEGRQVFGTAAGYPVTIANHLLVYPVATSVADIVLDGVVAGQCSASHKVRRDQQPGCMTDDGHGFASLLHLPDQLLRLWNHSQGIGVQRSAWKHNRVKI